LEPNYYFTFPPCQMAEHANLLTVLLPPPPPLRLFHNYTLQTPG